tara:strand:+ start:435 stop:1010 length:576 start_codon:yes stop_codon:yes gene_type:complete
MSFTKLLSTKQESGIGLVIIGAIIFLSRNDKDAGTLLAIIGWIMIIGGVNNLFYDFMRKRKITKRFQKNFYDSPDEKKIADYFKRKNVAFEHHPTIKVERFWWKISIPFGSIKIEPDFYLPEFDVYVEYWGMINDPRYKKEQYDKKKKLYKDNDLDMLSLYPKNLKNLDFVFTSKLLELFKKREGIQRKYR